MPNQNPEVSAALSRIDINRPTPRQVSTLLAIADEWIEAQPKHEPDNRRGQNGQWCKGCSLIWPCGGSSRSLLDELVEVTS
jgi:hypothetical protein